MIDAIATRRMTLNDREYQEGETVPMPLQQFQDLEPTGLVTRAPIKKASARRAKTSTARPSAAEPVSDEPIAPAPEHKSSDTAD